MLAQRGEPRAAIVVPAKPSKTGAFAASELQTYVKKVSGAELPILTEPGGAAKTLVFVGEGEATRALGFSAADLPPEGFLIKTAGNKLALLGVDKSFTSATGETVDDPLHPRVQAGTLMAVYCFVERYLGVRWLWPGDGGEAVRPKDTLIFGRIDYEAHPRWPVRRCRAVEETKRGKTLAAEGYCTDEDLSARTRAFRLWARRNGLGQSADIRSTWALSDLHERFAADHPEYFALTLLGRRDDGMRDEPIQNPKSKIQNGTKLCVSNAETIAQAAEVVRLVDPAPRLDQLPPDFGFCFCAACKALDPASGTKTVLRWDAGDYEWVSLSDRQAFFWNSLAAQLGGDRFLFVRAAGAHRSPPAYLKLHPQFVVRFGGFSYANERQRESCRADLKGWQDAGATTLLELKPFETGHAMPLVFARKLAADLKLCGAGGSLGVDLGVMPQHWATQGLNYYVAARLASDPDLDVNGLLDEYCQAGFGRAGAAVKKYLVRLEALTNDVAAKGLSDSQNELLPILAGQFTPEVIAECEGQLDEAARLAAKESEPVKARLAFLRQGLRYAALQAVALRAAARYNESAEGLNDVLAAAKPRAEFYADAKNGWAVNAPLLQRAETNPRCSALFGGTLERELSPYELLATLPAKWRFRPDPDDIGEREGWHRPDFDDIAWRRLAVSKPWEQQGFADYDGVAWYRVTFEVPAEHCGKNVLLRFGAVDESAWVYVNGRLAGKRLFAERDDWLRPFEVNVGDLLRYGMENVLAVRVQDRGGAGGLWKLVWLVTGASRNESVQNEK